MFHKSVCAEVPEILQWTLTFVTVEALDARLAEINSGAHALPRAFRPLADAYAPDAYALVYVVEPPAYYKIMYGCSG
jgi:hypothetical protein